MSKFLLQLWTQFWLQVDNLWPELVSIVQNYFDESWDHFPLGWIRLVASPYKIWILDRSVRFINDLLDWVQDAAGLLPGLVLGAVLIDQIVIDPKMRQRVMTLDQAALLPAKVIIELGFQKSQETLPREFLLAERVTKLERVFDFIRGKAGQFWKIILGSTWSRAVKLFFLAAKWGTVVAYLVLLWRYIRIIETDPDSLLFSAKLSNTNPRMKETARIRRRIGGVKP